ncbi:MAG: amino acid ABC transporter substrate-binding protein [Alphaproteobacteria bacterium]
MKFFKSILLAGMAASMSFAASAADTITLGSAISLTGKYSTNGIHSQNGYDLAVTKINEAGGVNVGGKNYMLEVKYYDDESSGSRGAQLAERLIQQDGVDFMLGPYSSGLTKAIAPITEKYGVPMVEAEGASRSLFNKGYKYLFAVLTTADLYLASAIDVAAETAKAEGIPLSDVKVALAFEPDPFSLDVREGVVDAIKRHGMNIVIDDKLPADLADMTSTLTKVRALKPHVLIVSGHSKGAVTATRQMAEMGISVPLVGMTHCEAGKLVTKFGDAANGFMCATQWDETLTYSDELFGSAGDFDKEFKASFEGYNVVPYQSAQAAAAVQVWADAFERAGSLDKDAVRDALAATDMKSFYGDIRFSDAGNNIAKPMVMRQIKDGKFVVVAPAKWAAEAADVSFK